MKPEIKGISLIPYSILLEDATAMYLFCDLIEVTWHSYFKTYKTTDYKRTNLQKHNNFPTIVFFTISEVDSRNIHLHHQGVDNLGEWGNYQEQFDKAINLCHFINEDMEYFV